MRKRHSSRPLYLVIVGCLLTAVLTVTVTVTVTAAAVAATCPCTVFAPTDVPAAANANDPSAVEVGMKFRADIDGFVTGVRFFKGTSNIGAHTGNLWTQAGANLATVTFSGESGSGWQQADFASPVAITAGTTYVISYHTTSGFYSFSGAYFGTPRDNPPLHGLQDGASGGNGVFGYGPSGFPTSSFNAGNYWVDAVFATEVGPDTTPPVVTVVTPSSGANGVATSTNVVATFNEALDPTTVGPTTMELRNPVNGVVSAAVTYSAGGRSATLDPNSSLQPFSTYTATLRGGTAAPRVTDVAGNALANDIAWSFTTGAPGPEQGPGGPILVIGDDANPFTRYYAEVLRAEGLNEFATASTADVSATLLATYDVVILGEVALTDSQTTMLSDWVNAGGNLITMRPDKKLAGLLGLTDAAGTLANSYLLVDTASAPGTGIVNQTIQFHGTADRYSLSGASTVATLFSDATTATGNPAVTMRSVGGSGGQAAAFTYDLARSVVYSRQGNPAWTGQERDGQPIVRSDDLFYGAKAGDVAPDWVDLTKVDIPHADEQQRLLANMVIQMNLDRKPLPRLWYLPSDKKAVIVHALDDHGTPDATPATLDRLNAASPTGCSVADWQCYRATSWVYSSVPMTDAQAVAYRSQGHDIGVHVNSGCADYASQAALSSAFTSELATFRARFPGLPPQRGNRTHCIPWTDWDSEPKVELSNGIRFDMNYYYWPSAWVQGRPGYFTGSGLPMRYAQQDGAMIDVYQAATQLVNENGLSYPAATNAMLDKALGPQGYYGVLGTHDDFSAGAGYLESLLSSAQSRGVSIVSGEQMLTWLDGRNSSSFDNIVWTNSSVLSFGISAGAGAGASNLSAMLPMQSASGTLQTITNGASPVSFAPETIKGISYARFSAPSGSYVATYSLPAPTTFSIFSPASMPTVVTDPDAGAVELGVKFRSDVAGSISGIRFYKGPQNTGIHVGKLWTSTGTLLGSVTFTGETASGWQQANFATPIAVTAGTTYVASYRAPRGRYSADESYFAANGVDNPPLHALRNGVSGANGVYRYGASAFPTSSYRSSNYWVDVVLTTAPAASDTTPPSAPTNLTATATSPSQVNVSWTASTDNVGVARYQVFRNGAATPLAEPTATTFVDSTVLAGTPYSYTVKAVDAAGNAGAASNTASVTTPSGVGQTLFASNAVPTNASANDANAVEVGMRFRADVNGSISAVRFYKGALNTGTHVANLWSTDGTLLATATSTNETASGWQQVSLTTPVAILAGTTYVVSYHTSSGFYSFDYGYFAGPVDNPPLHALADSSGGNGVYRYGAASGFPTDSYQASNYWVDIVFS